MNQILGGFFNILGKIVEAFFDIIIWIAEKLTQISQTISRVLGSILFLGCSVFVFIIPTVLIFRPGIVLAILAIVLIAILGNTAVSKLEYYKYIATEYLYGTATYYKSNKKQKPFRDYQRQYEEIQRENARKRHEEERREYEEEMRRRQERARDQYQDFYDNFRGFYWQSGGQSGYKQGQGGYSGAGSTGFAGSFKADYEKACDTLGVDYNADEYEIKLAYRKMAKKYHPDLNHDTDTTEKFKEINSAYEFLSEENIERYKNL